MFFLKASFPSTQLFFLPLLLVGIFQSRLLCDLGPFSKNMGKMAMVLSIGYLAQAPETLSNCKCSVDS